MVNQKRTLLAVVVVGVFIYLSPFVVAVSFSDDLHVNLQVTYDNGTIRPGTFNFRFDISPDSDCSEVVYSDIFSATTDNRGIISRYLENVSLDYSNQYWLCYYLDGGLQNASKLATTPYAFYAKNVSLSGIIADSNLNIIDKNISTTGWFKGFFNWLTSTNWLSFDGATLSFNETKLNETIDLRSGGSPSGQFSPIVVYTASTYDGNITNGSLNGYTAANAICNAESSGSHFCLKSEVLKTIANGNYSWSGTAWFQNGPPGYTANADDCLGWTTNSNVYLGPFWNWEANSQAGKGSLTNCAQSKVLMCCGGTF